VLRVFERSQGVSRQKSRPNVSSLIYETRSCLAFLGTGFPNCQNSQLHIYMVVIVHHCILDIFKLREFRPFRSI
jgi:hypothetical protein